MKLIQKVTFDTYGIALLNANTGRKLKWPAVNRHMAELLENTLRVLDHYGCIAIYTRGIVNNRLIRGSTTTTSTHANGLASTGYKHWHDGSVGPLGFDVRKVLFDNGGLQTSLVVDEPSDRKVMIKFCEEMGWRVYHKKPLKWADHIHIQPMDLKGVI